jgi:prenyl protein peptidase
MILFIGPLFEQGVVKGRFWSWIKGEHIRETLGSWIGWRNLVAGPVSEELMFRSLIIPLHLMAKMDPTRIVFITPLYFGIAHIHHFYEFVLTHPESPIFAALFRSLFQFTYTSLFGFFAAFVFLRSGSLYPAIAAHSFCNWVGLPRFWGRLKVEAGEPIGPPVGNKDDDNQREGSSNRKPRKENLDLTWTVTYYALLIVGAVGFYWFLFPLSESSNALVDFDGRAKGT